MILDLSTIIATSGRSLSFSEIIEGDAFVYDKSLCEIVSPVAIEGTIKNVGGAFGLVLTLKTDIRVSCARCAKDIDCPLTFSIDETVDRNNEDEDNVRFYNDSVDITDLLSASFMSSIDYKYLCSEDCKGLCPACGADLNIGDCDCRDDAIDPRLEVLKKFLKDT